MQPLFRASEGVLAQKMVTLATTVLLLQQMAIIPSLGTCRTCDLPCDPEYRRNGTWLYWQCLYCPGSAGKTGLRANTVLANSNTKFERFVIMMWHFTDRGKTYDQIMNACCIPSDPSYAENGMSRSTVAKWNQYFRYICGMDYEINKTQIGGVNVIIEIDESMFGKCKFGKGDRNKRRRKWMFGGVCRVTGMGFMELCPGNKRTKASLWPIIQDNIAPGSTIYSDGWRSYRRLPSLGYVHRWIDHSKHYVDPNDPSLNTNKIEGFWGNFKRWLPSSGPYNLAEYTKTYLWFQQRKIRNEDPFWCLVNLIKENNSAEVIKQALATEPDCEGFVYDEEEAELDAAEVDNNENSDSASETDDSDGENFNCVFCGEEFSDKSELISHMDNCMETEDTSQNQQFSCPYCSHECHSQGEVVSHMDKCAEDEDSLEDDHYNCPYCSEELIIQEDLIKHIEKEH